MPVDFQVSVRDAPHGVKVVEVTGDLDVDTAPVLRHFLESVLEQGCRRVVVDFANAYYVDSTGISLLLNVWNRLAQMEGRIAVVCTVPRIRKIFQIVNVLDVIPLVETEQAALAVVSDDALAG